MARPKHSRRGKKEWRRNISTADTDKYLAKSGRDERSGGPLDNVPSASLFFVDKAKGPPAPAAKLRKVDRARAKTLHCDSILQRSSLVPPLGWSAPRPKKAAAKAASKKQPPVLALAPKKPEGTAASVADLWADEDLGGLKAEGAGQERATKRRRVGPTGEPSAVPAVEVDQPGCSFNPAFQDHQEALAVAVAEVVVKEARVELQPAAPPMEVPASEVEGATGLEAELYAGLEALLPDAEGRAALVDAAADDVTAEEDDVAPGAPARPVRVQRKTRADLNRKLRRKEQEAARAAKLQRKRLLQDAGRVGELAAEVREEEQERERRRQRREAAKRDNRLEGPPRLGKHRFEPEPLNVMLTEEVAAGSLRQVKGCFTLARDRFKSLQKRGILEPRVPVKRKAAKRRKIVEMGTKGHKEREMHAEILAMRAARQAKGKGKGKGDTLLLE